MSTGNLKDECFLWNEFREGDKRAFSKLFNFYSDPLFRYGMKFIQNVDVVKDCIQDLFVNLYNNRTKIPQKENAPRLYLFKSLKNAIIDRIRLESRIVYVSPEDLQFTADYYFDPEEEDELDLIKKFENIMSTLTDRQKEMIYLKYQLGMSYDEISQLLNINVQSARNLLFRAFEKIRTEMALSTFITLFIKYIS